MKDRENTIHDESKNLNEESMKNTVIPIEVKRRIVNRKETKMAYKGLEANKDCIYRSNREIDTAALMLQVKLSNESTLDKDLEDPKVINHLKKYVDSRHPCKKQDNGEVVKFPICSTDTGNMGCGESQSKSDLQSLGLGMVIYFKVLKAYGILFFVLILLNIPLYYIYTSNHPEFKVTSYKDALFKTTIGNIGSTLYNCHEIPSSEIYKTNSYTFNLNCDSYNISSIISFGLSNNIDYTSSSFETCQNFTNFVNITTDDNCSFEDFLNEAASTNCFQKNYCSFTVDTTNIKRSCLPSLTYDYFFFSYSCYDSWVIVGNGYVDRASIAWIIVALDLASMASLLITMIIIPMSQERVAKFFRENVVKISDYTIHFKNLNFDNSIIYKELDDFIAHLNKIHHHENPYLLEEEDFIYDINFPLFNDKKIDMLRKRIQINSQIEEKEKELIKTQEDKLLEEIMKLKREEQELGNKIREAHYDCLPKINDVYITFTKQSYRNKILKAYTKGRCTRCCTICCCKFHTIKHYYFRRKWIDIDEATDQPSNIRWQNIPYSKKKRFIRKCIVILIAVIILAASLGIVIGSKYAQKSIEKDFNTSIDCSFVKYTEESVLEEFIDDSISNRNKYLTFCFCKDKLASNGLSGTKNYDLGNGVKPCDKWTDLYLKSESLMIGTIILVPFVNIVLSAILSILTELERNESVSVNISSSMIKSFLLQLINTAIIILIVNVSVTKIKSTVPDFPLFTGEFNDLDPGWYYQVGATFLFYMILNILTPHTNALISYAIALVKRCLDSKICVKKFTRKKSRKEFIDLYTGPQFNIGMRYSQILTTIFTSLIYSSGIPLLYLCCFFFFLITYWIDKFLILRLYRSPPHIDLYVSKLFNMIILVGMIIHFCFAIWIYGNTHILSDSSTSALKSISDWITNNFNLSDNSFAAEVLTRISYSYNILILFILAIIILIFLSRVLYLDSLLFGWCKCWDIDYGKVKDINIYEAIETKGLYLNHQIRKAQYFVVTDTEKNFPYYKRFYFEKMLLLDKYHIAKRLKESNNIDIDSSDKNFDEKLVQIIRNIKIVDRSMIHTEFSYNITYIPEFQVVAKHEFFDKYSFEQSDLENKNNIV